MCIAICDHVRKTHSYQKENYINNTGTSVANFKLLGLILAKISLLLYMWFKKIQFSNRQFFTRNTLRKKVIMAHFEASVY